MASSEISAIEAITYLSNTKTNRFAHLEMLQQQQQFQMRNSSPSREHDCNCMHHHHHHHSSNSGNGGSSSNFSPNNVTNGPYAHHHNHFNHLNQHMHSNQNGYISQQKQQQHHDGSLIYNNSTSSECNQATNDVTQNACNATMIHYIPTKNHLSALNIVTPPCECVGHIQHHHHQRQSSTEQSQSMQSGRSSRIFSGDENNPSGAEDSGISNTGIVISSTSSNGCRTSKRLL